MGARTNNGCQGYSRPGCRVMPIPALSEQGLLPPGLHDCSLDELGARFGTFQESDRRCRLFEKLRRYINEAQIDGVIMDVIIDGSFVTDEKAAPNDIDLLVVLRADQRPRRRA